MKEPNQATTSTGSTTFSLPHVLEKGGSHRCGISQCFIYLSWEVQALPTLFAIFQMGNRGTAYAVCELKGNCEHGKNQMLISHDLTMRSSFIASKIPVTTKKVGDLGSPAERSPLK